MGPGRKAREDLSRHEHVAGSSASQPTPLIRGDSEEASSPTRVCASQPAPLGRGNKDESTGLQASYPLTGVVSQTPSRVHPTRRNVARAVSLDNGAASSSSTASPRSRRNERAESRDVFNHPAFKEAIFPVQAQYAADPSILYQHVRSLHGVVRSSAHPVIETTPVPSCGLALDHYLQAMGYNIDAKLTINHALSNAYEAVDFVRKIVPQGIPVLEAKYMWALHKSEPLLTNWAERHIM